MSLRAAFIVGIFLLLQSSNSFAAFIPVEVKEAVTFIFVNNDKEVPVPNGTGFFLAIKDPQNTNISFGYLVTARHVLLGKDGHILPNIFIRLNRTSGGAELIPIRLTGAQASPVYFHKDIDVDIAVIPIVPDQNKYDFKFIPEEMLATRELLKQTGIKEGDEVFFTGLFSPFYGIKRNYPVVRFGRVALVTDEKVPWKDDRTKQPKLLDLYLVEAQSFGGNSGSPVFFYLTGTRDPSKLSFGYKILLAGVMQGTFLDAKEIALIETMDTRNVPYSLENVGIAAIVPGYKLHEILFSEKLQDIRTKHRLKEQD